MSGPAPLTEQPAELCLEALTASTRLSFTGRSRVFPKGLCLAQGGRGTVGRLRGKHSATKAGAPKCPPSSLHGGQHCK